MEIRRITNRLVKKIEDGHHTDLMGRRYDVSVIFFELEEDIINIAEFPRRFTEQEKEMILNKRIKYTKTDIGSYKLEILEGPYNHWALERILGQT